MQSFARDVALAALAANVSALCPFTPTECEETAYLADIQAAFDAAPTDYQWSFTYALPISPSVDYNPFMVRFTGNASGGNVFDQWTKRPVIFYQRENEDCFSPISDDTTAAELFEGGHDVWIVCHRGDDRDGAVEVNPNALSEENFWNFDIEDVGREDIPAIVEKVMTTRLAEGSPCMKAGIVTGGLRTSEVLAAAVAYPNSFDDYVSNVIGVAPCITSKAEQYPGFFSRRLGANKQEYRHLEALEETHRMLQSLDLEGVEALCAAYPEACYDYCEFFPTQCESFCTEFPDFCRPESVEDFADFVRDMKTLGYYALFQGSDASGDSWNDRILNYCILNGNRWCNYMRDTEIFQHHFHWPPLSLKQFEHQYQISNKLAYNQFSDTFFTDGWQEDAVLSPVDLTAIQSLFTNYFTETSFWCNIEGTQDIFDANVSQPGFYFQFGGDESDLDGSNAAFAAGVKALLAVAGPTPTDCSAFTFTD